MGIIGKKVGMTRVYSELGVATPVTVIEAGPCKVLQVKTEAIDGYKAIQVGFGAKKESRVNKPMSGHFQKSGGEGYYHIREFRVEDPQQYEVGQQLNPQEIFNVGDVVDVQGVSKGRGFQGVMKRHGFAGGSAGHGSGFYRAPGSIGCSAYPGRVMKGKKMAGRMGNDTVLKKNVLVIDVREEDSAILVKGPVPGANNGLIQIFTK